MSQLAPKFEYTSRPPRWASNAKVIVIDENGSQILGRLGNISEGGFMADCEEKVRLGSIVEATLPDRGTVSAEVRWVLGWRFGAMILEEI